MEALINEMEAASYLNLSRSFLRQARMHGEGPRFFKLGHLVKYKLKDLDHWVESRARNNTLKIRGEK